MTDARILPAIVWTAPCRRIPAHLECITDRSGVDVCTTFARLCDLLESHRSGVVVWDVTSSQSTQLERILDRLHRESPGVQVILCVDLNRHTARVLSTLASLNHAPQLVLWGFDNLAVVLDELDERAAQAGAHQTIAQHLLPSVPTSGEHLVASAILAGHRRVSPHQFAALCGLARRTLEWYLHKAQLPPPRRLLGMMLVLHGLWRMDYLGWSTKRVAHRSGFRSSHSWGNFVHRHTGRRPADLLAGGGFDAYVIRAAWQIRDDSLEDSPDILEPRCME